MAQGMRNTVHSGKLKYGAGDRDCRTHDNKAKALLVNCRSATGEPIHAI